MLDNTNHLKIIDFGTSLILDNGNNTDFFNAVVSLKEKYGPKLDEHETRERGDSFVGTPLYLSPEIISEEGIVEYPADLWALGIIIYQMLTGKLPNYDLSEFELFEKIKEAEIEIPDVRS